VELLHTLDFEVHIEDLEVVDVVTEDCMVVVVDQFSCHLALLDCKAFVDTVEEDLILVERFVEGYLVVIVVDLVEVVD